MRNISPAFARWCDRVLLHKPIEICRRLISRRSIEVINTPPSYIEKAVDWWVSQLIVMQPEDTRGGLLSSISKKDVSPEKIHIFRTVFIR